MKTTPKGLRLQIGIFGRRNAGKSSLLNALTRQQTSIVSPVPGTTTDPVEKPMEMLPLGPVLWIDTAGLEDSGALGRQRIEKSRRILDRADAAVLVVDADLWGDFEEGLLQELRGRNVPVVVAFNKSDVKPPPAAVREKLSSQKIPCVDTVASTGQGVPELREALIGVVPDDFLRPPPLLADLVTPGELAVLVTPIDLEAPKGRLILPQVQAIRDLLDGDAICLVVKEHGLRAALERLTHPPALVVTDSQAFREVAAATPPEVPMTSFSILMARQKGDLGHFVEGAAAIDRLRPGDRVLIAEACTHHPFADDIGRVKLPRWLNEKVGGELRFDTIAGHDFPDDLSEYKLVVHCGACMWNRREMLARQARCRQSGAPICNYGVTIAYAFGILERALAPFPKTLEAYQRLKQ